MKPVILFRKIDFHDDKEFEVAKSVFPTYEARSSVLPGSLVIPRYSALPFHKELETDITNQGSRLINTTTQHNYVANLSHWYHDFEDITPKTWFRLFEAGLYSNGPFVLKGETNSKKFSWKTHMYARDFQAAGDVYSRLLEDGLIGPQGIVVRKYTPLRNHGIMPSGVPISHEFRCFFYKDRLLTKAFYWSNEEVQAEDNVPRTFLDNVASRAAPNVTFWVADVAQTEQGDWIVVELNDGSMSGLSATPPLDLYTRLREEISNDTP
jgi:hypothetical protein